MIMNNFNFAQIAWLWALLLIPVGWFWAWYWQRSGSIGSNLLTKFADQSLLQHIIIGTFKQSSSSKFGWIYSILFTCIILAMANPRWNYNEIDAYAPTASMVILLDLSSTMNAEDIAPSRIVSARHSLEDLLNLSKGLKVGLIGFAAIPHLISPITDDTKTIKTFLPAIDTDLVSKQGNALDLAFKAAAELLATEPGDKKSILLVSDGNFADQNYSEQLKSLRARDIEVLVMGIGTATGAPYKDQSGNLHKEQGKLVISKLNQVKLQEIAKLGNGLYVEAIHTDRSIQSILNKAQQSDASKQVAAGKIRQWEDRYYLLLIPAGLLFLILISKRALYSFSLILILGALNSSDVQAFEIQKLFENADQQGLAEFTNANFAQAAEIFSDPYKKGVALYRAGQFAAAEQQFNAVQRSSVQTASIYNVGNCQMQQKKWRAAINSYERVLQIDPKHEDAIFNLDLARKMLAEQGEEQQEEDKEDKNQEQEQEKNQNSDNQENKNSDQKQEQEQEQKQNSEQEKPESKEPEKDKSPEKDSTPEADANQSAPEQEQLSGQAQAEQEARAQQWLNRIDSDIKVFLKNKFYIEDMLSAK
jgi:Ca-activated chloride channel family protein